jgi:hypothetical protein
MSPNNSNSEWTQKDGTLSDKTAFKEFGLTEHDITTAINEGKLQFREGSIYGSPYLRLLRSEVEKLAEEKFGRDILLKKKAKTELKRINKELTKLKLQIQELEKRKNDLELIIKS